MASANYENVRLWISNDEGFYDMARRAVRKFGNKDKAADAMYEDLEALDALTLPDGSVMSRGAIRYALRSL